MIVWPWSGAGIQDYMSSLFVIGTILTSFKIFRPLGVTPTDKTFQPTGIEQPPNSATSQIFADEDILKACFVGREKSTRDSFIICP